MKIAILFWCYKEPEICRERLLMVRKYNPTKCIYVLFGGAIEQAEYFARTLDGLNDDFWALDCKPSAVDDSKIEENFRGGVLWKWYYGDLLLLEWYKKRGLDLTWDTVFVFQWDMLTFAPIEKILKGLKKDQAFFSGVRQVSEVEELWEWTSPQKDHRENYLEFLEYARNQFGYTSPPLCCLAIVMALPRIFFEKFALVPHPEIGFIEYKLPTYADLFEIEISSSTKLDVWWDDIDPYSWKGTLHAVTIEIEPLTILLERCRPYGGRVFHPYSRAMPKSRLAWRRLLMNSARRILSRSKIR